MTSEMSFENVDSGRWMPYCTIAHLRAENVYKMLAVFVKRNNSHFIFTFSSDVYIIIISVTLPMHRKKA